MRHRRDGRHLSRTAEHRRALLRNLVTELFRHERIETTIAKAKEARRVAERMITFAKRGDLSARRHVGSYLFDETVTKKLFDTIAPWYTTRNGGYTRIIRTRRRLGDAGEMGIFELVKSQEQIDAERHAREAAEAAARDTKKKKAKTAEPAEGVEAEAAAPEKGKKPKPTKTPKPTREAKTRDTGTGAQKDRGKAKTSQKKGATKASKKG
jgi:large subunit ribosomal protein L17